MLNKVLQDLKTPVPRLHKKASKRAKTATKQQHLCSKKTQKKPAEVLLRTRMWLQQKKTPPVPRFHGLC